MSFKLSSAYKSIGEVVKILNNAGKKVSFTEIETDKGHDSFLLNEPDLYKTISGFLNGNYNN